jgi:mono/diheme cytochrome c family protein
MPPNQPIECSSVLSTPRSLSFVTSQKPVSQWQSRPATRRASGRSSSGPARLLAWSLALFASRVGTAETVDFAGKVFPILRRHCLECHGQRVQEAGLRLDRGDELLASGSVVPGRAEESELLRRVSLPKGHDAVMPAVGEPVTKAEVAILRRWITEGAVWPADFQAPPHWAYVPPVRAEPLPVSDPSWVQSPIDAFVLRRLDVEGLAPSPRAAPEKLVRRLYFDLIGLPPTPAEVNEFVGDPSKERLEQLVEELLGRPQFGERWARPWLDLARYADSHGFQRDDLREIWPYRDWVIRALNVDMPFDQFTMEQMGGDLLPDATESQKVATGFHRATPTNVEAGSLPEETRIEQVFDRVNTTATVWLGTTLECCQCHDHKYDPFPMEDYYRMLAFFNNTVEEAARADPKNVSSIRFEGPSLTLFNPEHHRNESAPVTTLVMAELDAPRQTTVFQRGNYQTPGQPVEPGTPSVLHPLQEGPRNRLTLARWLVSRENPLVARVVVNRWWAELFGQGLVTTLEDFGLKGAPPTHPELLDWLAVELMENGWSQKKLLKMIVLSATYQQSSLVTSELLRQDDRNRLLARGPRFRMDAEMIRDNALAISGLLSRKQFGPPIRPYQPEGLWAKVGGEKYTYEVSPGDEQYRRGIYVVLKRGSAYPSFLTFDATNRMTCLVKRSRTNTPLQALTLLNDPVYVDAATALAGRVLTGRADGSLDQKLDYAFQLCTARKPTDRERKALRDLYHTQRKQSPEHGEDSDATAREAWFSVARALLNLHETITKD